MKTLVLANQKGGVGKSALATQLAHYIHRTGRSVVVLDLDHQQNTSRALRGSADVRLADISATAIFDQASPIGVPEGRFVLVAGDDQLSGLERQPDQHNAFATRLRDTLRAWNRFDVCIVDTNPNPDIRYAAALVSADYVLAPIQLNQEAIAGISALLAHPRYGITRIQATLNPGLTFLGILPNMVEHTPFQKANLEQLASKFGSRLVSDRSADGIRFGYLPKRTAIPEAQAAGEFVGDLTKTSARDAWRDIRPVFDMILAGMGLGEAMERTA